MALVRKEEGAKETRGSEQRWRATPEEMAIMGLCYCGNGTMLPPECVCSGGPGGQAREGARSDTQETFQT